MEVSILGRVEEGGCGLFTNHSWSFVSPQFGLRFSPRIVAKDDAGLVALSTVR